MFLLFYFLWTLFTYQDFGETWDESGVYARGIALFHHFGGDFRATSVLTRKAMPDDGLVLYDHLYASILSLLNPAGDVDVYHWLNLAFAALLFIAAYELLFSLYRIPLAALLGPLFIVLTPRFLGDIPANPKDMPFAVLYFLSLTAIYFINQYPRLYPVLKGLILGILFGLAQCTRLLGLSLFGVYLLFEVFIYWKSQKSKSFRELLPTFLRKTLFTLFITLCTSVFLLFLSWPYLQSGFLDHIREILTLSKNFPWQNNVLFLGKEIPATSLPWTYLPLWFLITTPLFILFFLGFAFFLRDKLKNRLLVLLALTLGLNFFLYLALRPVLYDSLRHFLFFLPILGVLAAMAMIEFFKTVKSVRFRNAVFVLTSINVALVFIHLVRLHPYEYVYFNELAGGLKGSEGRFDNDYWGASYKEAVEWLKRNEAKDGNRVYKINGAGNSYQIAYYFAPNMKWSELKDADYYLACTRDDKHKLVDASKVIHKVEREGVALNYVFKLK